MANKKNCLLGRRLFLIIPLDAQRKNKNVELTSKNAGRAIYVIFSRTHAPILLRGPMLTAGGQASASVSAADPKKPDDVKFELNYESQISMFL